MAKNPIGFQVTNTDAGFNQVDFDDLFIRKDCFLEGGLWLWGSNSAGAIGDSTSIIANKSSPVQTIAGGSNWKEIALGGTVASAIKTDGTLWTWGAASNGQLGTNNHLFSVSSPVQTVSGGTDWKQVSAGRSIGAIKADGSLWMWGSNTHGNLGTADAINRSSPVQTVSGGTNWKSVSVGITGYFTGAIKTDGTLWMWGAGTSVLCGGIGDNATVSRSSPVQTVSGGTDWKNISLGRGFAVAVKNDGTLWLWGDSTSGQMGRNSTVGTSSPVQTISSGTNWKQASNGITTVAAIKTDGTLWLWGANICGSLGENTPTACARSSPVQTVSGGTNWRCVSVNCTHVGAIKTDGTLWLWGNGASGVLGNNAVTFRSSPVQTVSGGTNWKKANAGGINTGAIREDCW